MRGKFFFASLLPAASAPAAFTVNSPADVVDKTPGDGSCDATSGLNVCTLRAAIQEANATPGLATITIILPSAGPYGLSIPGANEYDAATGDLDVWHNVTVWGPGPDRPVIDGGQLDRVFHVITRSLTLTNITVQHGRIISDYGGGVRVNSGAALALSHSEVNSNTVIGTAFWGGGVYNQGSAVFINSTISQNTAYDGGGVGNSLPGSVRFFASIISDNSAFAGGGIINSAGAITLTNSTISGNDSIGSGGGLFT